MPVKIRLQRNIAITGFLLMFVTNSILAVVIYRQDKSTILVPGIENRFEVSSNSASKDYLRLRAIEVHNLLFGMNKDNCHKIAGLILQTIDHGTRAEASKQLQVLSKDIKERDYYYNFTDIIEYRVAPLSYKVEISGYLETFMGDKRINRELRTYLYQFINHNGTVLLSSFREVQGENN